MTGYGRQTLDAIQRGDDMSQSRQADVLSFLSSAVQNLAHFADSHCPRAERHARMALERLERLSGSANLDGTCEAIEILLDREEKRR